MTTPRQTNFSEDFTRRLKDLKKKYRHIENDLRELLNQLKQGEILGDRLQGAGELHCL
jgi:mRNA-degrading endonuclease YafQ of YafQ-DinJ toxin-antitoxin module